MFFAREGEGVAGTGGTSVTEEIAENVSEEIGKESGFLEVIGAARGDQIGPRLEFWFRGFDAPRQSKGMEVLADNFRVEEGLGFNGHESGED
jgi:hypothetical protein